jgi:hypothetical protein
MPRFIVLLLVLLVTRKAFAEQPDPLLPAGGVAAPVPVATPPATASLAEQAQPDVSKPRRVGIEPLRIAIECQGESRTKVCPAFLLGFVEASPVILSSPRASAQVILYVSSVSIANEDRVHLRFVGDVRGAPASIEVDVSINTRGTDDEQRAQLHPAFLRGVALYIAAIDPDGVKIEIVTPVGEVVQPDTTPWGFNVSIDGHGSWTKEFKSANANTSALFYRLDETSRYTLELTASGGLSRRPPLVVDGREVSLDTDEWSTGGSAFSNWNLNKDWAVGASAWVERNDPKGQLRSQQGANVGLSWDLFPSDDPRGNVLAVVNFLSVRRDHLNFVNEIGQRTAIYGFNRLSVVGKVRRDKTTLGLNFNIGAEVLHPSRRYSLSISPSIGWQLGDHVDLSFSFLLGARALPQPVIPDDDLEALGRASYAEPLFADGTLTLKVHFDPTNGVRNNRFENL